MTALLLGSISTLADTSERQREAFNAAFAEHGLDWTWDRDEYRSMLSTAGGRDRIAAHAESVGADVDADAIHATKSRLFQESVAADGLTPRAGVVDTVRAARDAGQKVGLVTTTSRENVDAMLAGLSPDLGADRFDVIVSRDDVDEPKPAAAAYEHALSQLGVQASDAIAVEDNTDGVDAATAAGVTCVAFPNENTADHDFSAADRVVDQLDPSMVS